eukprot:UN18378
MSIYKNINANRRREVSIQSFFEIAIKICKKIIRLQQYQLQRQNEEQTFKEISTICKFKTPLTQMTSG